MSVLYGDDIATLQELGPSGEKLVSRLAASVEVLQSRTKSGVIAIVGPWGSGKSTLLSHLEERLAEDRKWRIANFNPWAYSSLEVAVSGFFSEIIESLPDTVGSEIGKTRKDAVGAFIDKYSPLGGLAGLVGIDGEAALKSTARVLMGDQSPESQRVKTEKLLATMDQPILMLVDDLDRLGPEELLQTFKLVRLLGRLPNLYYVLSYDEATLHDILLRTGLVGKDKTRAREYMEKMIQLRFDIPTLMPQECWRLVSAATDEVRANHGIELSAEDTGRLTQIWSSCLARYIKQPRAIKRLFTQVDATFTDLAGEVDFVDYIAMTFLRTFEPATFELIEERSRELLGGGTDLWGEGDKETGAQRWDRWLGYLKAVETKHTHEVASLLANLFIPLKSAKNTGYSSVTLQNEFANKRRVGHRHYFHRYTQRGIPIGDIQDSDIQAFVEELVASESGDATELVLELVKQNTERVTSKLLKFEKLPATELLAFVLKVCDSSSTEENGIKGFPGMGDLTNVIEYLLVSASDDEAVGLVKQGSSSKAGLTLMCATLKFISLSESMSEDDSSDTGWFAQAKEIVSAAIRADMMKLPKDASDDVKEASLENIWTLRDFSCDSKMSGLTGFVWELIDSENGWIVEDFLTLLLIRMSGSDGDRSWTSLKEFSSDSVESFLGFDRVSNAIGDLSNLSVDDVDFSRRNYDKTDLFAEKKHASRVNFARLLESSDASS